MAVSIKKERAKNTRLQGGLLWWQKSALKQSEKGTGKGPRRQTDDNAAVVARPNAAAATRTMDEEMAHRGDTMDTFSEVVVVVPSLDTADTIVKEKRKKKKEVVVVEG